MGKSSNGGSSNAGGAREGRSRAAGGGGGDSVVPSTLQPLTGSERQIDFATKIRENSMDDLRLVERKLNDPDFLDRSFKNTDFEVPTTKSQFLSEVPEIKARLSKIANSTESKTWLDMRVTGASVNRLVLKNKLGLDRTQISNSIIGDLF